jgi:hypothetical protein
MVTFVVYMCYVVTCDCTSWKMMKHLWNVSELLQNSMAQPQTQPPSELVFFYFICGIRRAERSWEVTADSSCVWLHYVMFHTILYQVTCKYYYNYITLLSFTMFWNVHHHLLNYFPHTFGHTNMNANSSLKSWMYEAGMYLHLVLG